MEYDDPAVRTSGRICFFALIVKKNEHDGGLDYEVSR